MATDPCPPSEGWEKTFDDEHVRIDRTLEQARQELYIASMQGHASLALAWRDIESNARYEKERLEQLCRAERKPSSLDRYFSPDAPTVIPTEEARPASDPPPAAPTDDVPSPRATRIAMLPRPMRARPRPKPNKQNGNGRKQ